MLKQLAALLALALLLSPSLGLASSSGYSTSSTTSSSSGLSSSGSFSSSSSGGDLQGGCIEAEESIAGPWGWEQFEGTQRIYFVTRTCGLTKIQLYPVREVISARATKSENGEKAVGSLYKTLSFTRDGQVARASGSGFLMLEQISDDVQIYDGAFTHSGAELSELLHAGGDGRPAVRTRSEVRSVAYYRVTRGGDFEIAGGSFSRKENVTNFEPTFDGYNWAYSLNNTWGAIEPGTGNWLAQRHYERASKQSEASDAAVKFSRSDVQTYTKWQGDKVTFQRTHNGRSSEGAAGPGYGNEDTELTIQYGRDPKTGELVELSRSEISVGSSDDPVVEGGRMRRDSKATTVSVGTGRWNITAFQDHYNDGRKNFDRFNLFADSIVTLGTSKWHLSRYTEHPDDDQTEINICSSKSTGTLGPNSAYRYEFNSLTGEGSYGDPSVGFILTTGLPEAFAAEKTECHRFENVARQSFESIALQPFSFSQFE